MTCPLLLEPLNPRQSMSHLSRCVLRPCFCHVSHLFQPQRGDLAGIASPQIFAEQFQRQPSAITDFAQQVEVAVKIHVSFTGHDSAVIVLLFARRC